MSHATISSDSNRVERMQAYRSSTSLERAIVELLAIAYEPLQVTQLVEAMKAAKLYRRTKSERADFSKALANVRSKKLVRDAKPSGSLICDRAIVEVVTRETVREGTFEPLAKSLDGVLPAEMQRHWTPFRSFAHGMRLLRLHLYRGDHDGTIETLNILSDVYEGECNREFPVARVFRNPFDAEWLAAQPPQLVAFMLWVTLNDARMLLQPADDEFAFLERYAQGLDDPSLHIYLIILLATEYVFRGRVADAETLLRDGTTIGERVNLASCALFRADYVSAQRGFADGLEALRQAAGKRTKALWDHHAIFHVLSLLPDADANALKRAHTLLKDISLDKSNSERATASLLAAYIELLLPVPKNQMIKRVRFEVFEEYPPLYLLVQCMILQWVENDVSPEWLSLLEDLHTRAVNAGYLWFAGEAAAILTGSKKSIKKPVAQSLRRHEEQGLRPLVDLVRRVEEWERGLDALGRIAEIQSADAAPTAEVRLAWHIKGSPSHIDTWTLEVREVKRKASGRWTKGKPISLKRLATQRDGMPFLTPQDQEVCSYLTAYVDRDNYASTQVIYRLQPRAWLALVGHPMVYSPEGNRVEIVQGEPELHVTEKGKHVIVDLQPRIEENDEIALIWETATRLKVVACTAAQRRIAGILGGGLRVPVAQKNRVLETLSRTTSLITVHSSIGGGLENVPEVAANPLPHVVLAPAGDGLRVQLKVRPLEHGSYYRPGFGGDTVMAEVDGRRVQTRRDLAMERRLASDLVAACAALGTGEELEGEWAIDDLEQCLELLEQLHALSDSAIVEWPQGESLRVTHRATSNNFQVRVSGGQDWFQANAKLACGDDCVLDMRQLIELLGRTPGRFLRLGDGQFLALTKELRKRLDELRGITEQHGDGLRFHPLAAPAIEGVLDGEASLKVNKAWKEQLARFEEAQAFDPKVPSTLRATLRDYQVEGFQWMARLARWGAGACLADDMGLGKTVQALALVLEHAADGPALVVAPTSVCMNWLSEAQRFAPTLRSILFGPGDRQAALDALKPFDLLVCSYGLLHQEAEKLTAVRWRVAILDEAQAIKNMATRRSQAAMNLKADFRAITTGTPIENHLGELWNLFRFINPGLLRSLDHFNHRFAVPIEKLQDREAKARLKKIIQPFILRRLKEQVLDELPPRTEIVLHVEFSEEEKAFYEALRRKAVETIAAESGDAPGQKHLRILAELMRLRRACCNPVLVTPGADIPSSKLKVFLHLVDELLENRHKALVFSQFVDHLSILREALDKRGIAYQYLDGSTPQRERKKRLDAFQAGEGDLFLISLKAGGLGLNLTAADYVIHMDPWWNPAAEDQASDRAHRIGQQRPVTIYRLVTEGTIESKIVDLHKHKRDLADSLLEGTEMSGKMSADELLALLQEGV